MNFKADWSFLEKISMGAVSSKQVVKLLNDAGHDVIELERYSTSNKIWATKIKRLRMKIASNELAANKLIEI